MKLDQKIGLNLILIKPGLTIVIVSICLLIPNQNSEAKNTKFVKGNFYEGKIKWKEIKIWKG